MTNHSKAWRPIAIFDSGVGGLTVAEALKKKLPNESFLYLADTASRPFGMKSPQALREILQKNMNVLMSYPIKMLVIACHTACSSDLSIFNELQVPILSIIPATIEAISDHTDISSLLVLGTNRTIDSNIYQQSIKKYFPHFSSFFLPCSPLEKLIEEKCNDSILIQETLEKLFHPIEGKSIEASLLACTHFPIYKDFIKIALGKKTSIIDPSIHFVDKIYDELKKHDLLNLSEETSKDQYLITEDIEAFKTKLFYYFGSTLAETNPCFNHPYAMM